MPEDTVNLIGLGYIGSLLALHLAGKGHRVIAVDKDEGVLEKERWFSRYNDIEEAKRPSMLENIKTTTDYSDIEGDTSVVCVNTPTREKSADLSNVKNVMRALGGEIDSEHEVILRSTVPPRTCEDEIVPLLEREAKLDSEEKLHFCYGPEFIRGGTGLEELRDPSKTVVSGDRQAIESFLEIFPISENRHETSIRTAEAVKYFDNAFHGLKISLANECGRLGQELGLDPTRVMDIISSDYRLNVSDMYMSPGKSFGGPCLSKDIKVLEKEAESRETEAPVISSINKSNEEHSSWIVEKIVERNPDRVGIIGATYKKGFNSVSNSASLEAADSLEQKGFDVLIYEPGVELEGYRKAERQQLDEADLWIVFNEVDGVEDMKDGFDGDIIDLANFSF